MADRDISPDALHRAAKNYRRGLAEENPGIGFLKNALGWAADTFDMIADRDAKWPEPDSLAYKCLDLKNRLIDRYTESGRSQDNEDDKLSMEAQNLLVLCAKALTRAQTPLPTFGEALQTGGRNDGPPGPQWQGDTATDRCPECWCSCGTHARNCSKDPERPKAPEPVCAGPFVDARDCPVHAKDLRPPPDDFPLAAAIEAVSSLACPREQVMDAPLTQSEQSDIAEWMKSVERRLAPPQDAPLGIRCRWCNFTCAQHEGDELMKHVVENHPQWKEAWPENERKG